jgi:4,5:9,10-diseco-3-hydroxy-5,9,17-trioxoandrosta-1(10),2-diene-4-oate hydrolase
MEFLKNSVAAGGCQLEYAEGGVGHALVFLHGGGGFRFDEQTFLELAKDYRVLIPSMPGFDGSTAGTTSTLEDVADVIADFIRAVSGQPAHVIGESFGGGVATWLAIRHPEVVDRLVLAAPSALRDGSGLSPSSLTPAERFTLLYGGRPRDAGRPEDQERVRRNRASSDRIHASRPEFDQALVDRLPDIRTPTLLIWGSLDRLIPPNHARYYATVPDQQLIVLEGGPHVLSAGVPEAFVAAVREFLDARFTGPAAAGSL